MSTIRKFYKGFSTRRYRDSGGAFDLYNIEVVNEDLLNEIFTIKGERAMMPDFGTRIPLLQFELNDPATQKIIIDDLTQVFNNDPRVELVALDILPALDTYAIIAVAKLNYIEFHVTKDLRIVVTSR